jgi:hypothetical protein
MLGKSDNEDDKEGKSNKGKGMGYSEQLFLTHSFLLHLTGSQYHALAKVMTRTVRVTTGMARRRVMMRMARSVMTRMTRTMTRMTRATMRMARMVTTRTAR